MESITRREDLPHELPTGWQGEAWTTGYGRKVVLLRFGALEVMGGGESVVIALSRARMKAEAVLAGDQAS